jgi:cyanophycinase
MRHLLSLLFSIFWLSACASTPRLPASATGLQGSLVIAGGGMDERSKEVRQAFLERRLPGPVGVIGAASSDSLGSARRGVAGLNEVAGGQIAVALAFDSLDPALADDPDAVAMIEVCGGLWFTGGSQARILEALRPGGRESAAWLACQALLDRGGVIGGSSAGAAMMSDPMIRRGRSASAMSFGVGEEGVEIGQGMGLFPWGLVGQHFLERGRFGRMIVALSETQTRFGWGIDEDSAILVDRATGWVEVIGANGLALFDMSELRASTGRWDGVILSLLGDGDRVNALTGEVVAALGSSSIIPSGQRQEELVIEELFSAGALKEAVHQLVSTNRDSVFLREDAKCALLRRGASARAWRPGEDSALEFTSAAGLRLDLYGMSY